jgi:hypothetical protein
VGIQDSIFVHVGFPDQAGGWLRKNWFHAENGYVTVMTPREVNRELVEPAASSFDSEGLALELQQRVRGIDEELVPVLSSARLSGDIDGAGAHGRQAIERLAALAPRARLLLVVREQRRMIRGLYEELVTRGMSQSLGELLNPKDLSQSPLLNLEYFRFDERVAFYQELFGVDQVKVLPYEALESNPAGFLAELARFAHVSVKFKDRPGEVVARRSLSETQGLSRLYLRRWRNYLLRSQSGRPAWSPATRRKQPGYVDEWLERRFMRRVEAATAGKFAAGNRRLQALTQLDLESFDYQL